MTDMEKFPIWVKAWVIDPVGAAVQKGTDQSMDGQRGEQNATKNNIHIDPAVSDSRITKIRL